MYQLRDEDFTFADAQEPTPFFSTITESPEFDFGMDDIRSLRRELGELIDRLSYQYTIWKAEEERNAKIAKAERKQKAMENKSKEDDARSKKQILGSSPRAGVVNENSELMI